MGIRKTIKDIILLVIFTCLLQGCASSELSRGTAGSVDQAYIDMTSGHGQVDVPNTYQNSSQTTKGVLIGGIAGGVIGAMNGILIPAAAAGAIMGGALGAYIDAHATLIDKLINRGVQVFVLGDQIMLVVQSNRVFVEGTGVIRNSFYPTIDLMVQLIGRYTNMSVKVAANSNDTNRQVDCALTQLQAENVSRAMWKRGINTRLLYAAGLAGTHLVTANSPGSYANDNYRLEITFEKLPI
jgi:outer membrane lipoprotein SlyB